MKLIERYALSSGLKIGRQFVLEKFYPLPCSRYITLHASSGGGGGKNYPYYLEVINAIKPALIGAGIEIVQMGGKDDAPLPGCIHLMGKYGYGQGCYILRNALLHLGNDSVWGHRAGHIGVPLVQPFGPTDPDNHGAFDYDPSKTIFLRSHRGGRRTSFVFQEQPQTISYIDPFDIARAVLKLLNLPTVSQHTQFIGQAYLGPILDFVPNMPLNPGFNAGTPTAIRMDLEHNEQILAQVLQSGRKVNVVTKAPINLDLLRAFAGNIQSYNHEIGADCPVSYLKEVCRIIPARTFFTRAVNEDEVAALRFKFFDIVPVQQITDKTKKDYENGVKEYLNNPDFSLDSDGSLDRLRVKSNKVVLSRGKIYLSLAHERADKPIEGNVVSGQVIDSPDFWRDMHHFMVYTE